MVIHNWLSHVAKYDLVNAITDIVFLSGNDYCEANVTGDYPDGDIRAKVRVEVQWPATRVGWRRIVRCGYASYAHRDCRFFSTDRMPKWSDPHVGSCSESTFSQGVDQLATFTVSDLQPLILFQSK